LICIFRPITCTPRLHYGCICSNQLLCQHCFPGRVCGDCWPSLPNVPHCDSYGVFQHRILHSRSPIIITPSVSTTTLSLCEYCLLCSRSCLHSPCGYCDDAECSVSLIEYCRDNSSSYSTMHSNETVRLCVVPFSKPVLPPLTALCSHLAVCEYCSYCYGCVQDCGDCDISICENLNYCGTDFSKNYQHSVIVTNYTLCAYCDYCNTCEGFNCGDCNLELCAPVSTVCTCELSKCMKPPCHTCHSRTCYACQVDINSRQCLGDCQWDIKGIAKSYKVGYHVEITGLAASVCRPSYYLFFSILKYNKYFILDEAWSVSLLFPLWNISNAVGHWSVV